MSGMIPLEDKNRESIIDFLFDACQHKVSKGTDQNGNNIIVQELDEKKAWYKMLVVNSPFFGRFAKLMEDFGSLAVEAYNFMPAPRARILAHQIQTQVENYMYSMDAKSAETLRDKHNSQQSVMHMFLKNKQERAITLKEEAGRSFKDALLNREKKESLD